MLVHEHAAVLDGRRVDARLDHVEVVALLRLPAGRQVMNGKLRFRSGPLRDLTITLCGRVQSRMLSSRKAGLGQHRFGVRMLHPPLSQNLGGVQVASCAMEFNATPYFGLQLGVQRLGHVEDSHLMMMSPACTGFSDMASTTAPS